MPASTHLVSHRAHILPAAVAVATLVACGGPKVPPSVGWLPEAPGWELQDVDDARAPLWALYERDSPLADVKEFRIVGLIDAEPAVAMDALKFRLLDEQYVPESLERQVVSESEHEIVVYGRTPLPFPFKDREATERMVFSEPMPGGGYRVVADLVEPDTPPPDGVVRVPLIENAWVLEPTGDGRSRFTIDTVHDVGNGVLNVAIYGPIKAGLVDDVHLLRELLASRDEGATR